MTQPAPPNPTDIRSGDPIGVLQSNGKSLRAVAIKVLTDGILTDRGFVKWAIVCPPF